MKETPVSGLYCVCAAHTKTLSSIAEKLLQAASAERGQEEEALRSLESVSVTFEEAIKEQGKEARDIIAEAAQCAAAFAGLKSVSASFLETFAGNAEKLKNMKAPVDIVLNSSALLEDINKSFAELYAAGSAETWEGIQNIVNKLNLLTGAVQGIQNSPKPYTAMISLYTQRMERTLESLNNAKITPLVNSLHALIAQKKEAEAAKAAAEAAKTASEAEARAAAASPPHSLPTDIERIRLLESDLRQSGKVIESLKKRKSAKPAGRGSTRPVTVIAIIALLVTNIVGISMFRTTKADFYATAGRLRGIESEYEEAKHLLLFTVNSVKVGNANSANKWINEPGDKLYAEKIRYFNPVMYVNAPAAVSDLEFFIKIFSPTGELSRNESSSPEGFSYKTRENIKKGENTLVDFEGWGSGSKSIYTAGEWRVEIWFNGVRVGEETVTLY